MQMLWIFVQFQFLLFHYPFPKQEILDTSKLWVFTGYNVKFDENGKKFAGRIKKKTEGKVEIAGYEQFLLFPTVFSEDLYCRVNGIKEK